MLGRRPLADAESLGQRRQRLKRSATFRALSMHDDGETALAVLCRFTALLTAGIGRMQRIDIAMEALAARFEIRPRDVP
jgi:hypothetical protein